MKQFFVVLAALFTMLTPILAQQNDPTLFTVANKPVALSEFKYIYEKTNGAKADYSRASVEEYLDLYTKFKLKVQKAHDMRLDTITSLKTELEGYRKQLANSYLIDKEVTDKLILEAYTRSQKDIDFSHILVRAMPSVSPIDSLNSYKKIQAALDRLKKGEDWNKVVKDVSEDANTRNKDGKVGFVAAIFPNGFYPLENAVYSTPVGKFSGIVRTDLGYHIVRVDEIRDARGEMEIGHIMI
ncbi:MAG: peptidylprolyl isomerase, partial [Saprospiraceae bacterium]